MALWNGKDPFLKERLFGLSEPEGNHGEDVKEYYYYLDNTPTHSYMKMLYKYPQEAFPYQRLREENKKRGYNDPEFELIDTGIFDQDRYFDVSIEYAKGAEEDILVRCTVETGERKRRNAHWFRRCGSATPGVWGYGDKGPMGDDKGKPQLKKGMGGIELSHPVEGEYFLYADESPELIFTENETNQEKLFKQKNAAPYVKDGFHRYLVGKEKDAVNPLMTGTKGAAVYRLKLGPGEKKTVRLRLVNQSTKTAFKDFDAVFNQRQKEADEFYAALQPKSLSDDQKNIQRTALAGFFWSKQLYYLMSLNG